MMPSTDALTAALVLRRGESSRNRNFAIHATGDAARARRRATRLRGLVRQITGAFGPARDVVVTPDRGEVSVRYALARVALVRELRMSVADLSILRVALHHAGARLLPAGLMMREDDRVAVNALLEEFAQSRTAIASP